MITTRAHSVLVLSCLAIFSVALATACGSDPDPEPDAPIPDPVGTFSASWSINAGGPVDCDDVGADSLRISATEINSAFGNVVGFTCSEGSGTSREFAAGTYRLDFDLRTGNGRSLLAAPLRVEDVVITTGTDTPVEAQTFTVIPSGSLAFTTSATGAAMGNCALEADGGAGINGMHFNLRDKNMECVPTTFTIADGVLPGGTYMSDCMNVTPNPCIGADQMITVDPTPSGARTLEIVGITEGDLACRRHLAQYEQPGNNLPLALGDLGMLLDQGVPGCELP